MRQAWTPPSNAIDIPVVGSNWIYGCDCQDVYKVPIGTILTVTYVKASKYPDGKERIHIGTTLTDPSLKVFNDHKGEVNLDYFRKGLGKQLTLVETPKKEKAPYSECPHCGGKDIQCHISGRGRRIYVCKKCGPINLVRKDEHYPSVDALKMFNDRERHNSLMGALFVCALPIIVTVCWIALKKFGCL